MYPVQQLAKIAYEVIRTYRETTNGFKKKKWDEASNKEKADIVRRVVFHLDHPNIEAKQAHDLWVQQHEVENPHPLTQSWNMLTHVEQNEVKLMVAVCECFQVAKPGEMDPEKPAKS